MSVEGSLFQRPRDRARLSQRRVRSSQRGVALVAATLALLVTMTLMAGYLHRSLLFGSRSASNQWRATRAFHAAEAGMDWAVAHLNDPTPLDDDCLPAPIGSSFRDRYLHPDASGGFSPTATTGVPAAEPASCVIGPGVLRCRCPSIPPAAGSTPAAAESAADTLNDDARFTVEFNAVAADPRAVVLTARGCTDLSSSCTSTDDQALLQAFAGVQAIVKLPAAASQPDARMAIVPGSWHDE